METSHRASSIGGCEQLTMGRTNPLEGKVPHQLTPLPLYPTHDLHMEVAIAPRPPNARHAVAASIPPCGATKPRDNSGDCCEKL
ncbi:hypothetical protein TIFTF001_039875 [Ficus carica]|uniref:Uncharacterized protein n=1 Tax=Ficus carica TaxID=3494 RepID=A0AA88CJC3_FICCA|nr:hypothetical protein TIFTF001_039875 [Ficus carica]